MLQVDFSCISALPVFARTFPELQKGKVQLVEANCAVLEFMAMKILPHLPCWTEVSDPKIGCWEFVSVRRQHHLIWEKVRFAVANYFLKERHPASISARIYGKTHDSAKVTVVVCSANISKQQYAKLQALCTPFAVLPIVESVRPTVATPAPPTIIRRYEKILTHGISLGVKGVDSSGSFGGYLKVNNEIFGTTCSHCVVPDTKSIKYRETPYSNTIEN